MGVDKTVSTLHRQDGGIAAAATPEQPTADAQNCLQILALMSEYVRAHQDQAEAVFQFLQGVFLIWTVYRAGPLASIEEKESGHGEDTVKYKSKLGRRGSSRALDNIEISKARLVNLRSRAIGDVPKSSVISHGDRGNHMAAPPIQPAQVSAYDLRPSKKTSYISIRGGSGGPAQDFLSSAILNDSLYNRVSSTKNRPQEDWLPYGNRRLTTETNHHIMTRLSKDLSKFEQSPMGWIYAFTDPRVPDENARIKIGHTRREDLSQRLRDIHRKCSYEPKVVIAFPVPNSARYEALVHASLYNFREKSATACVCKVKHQEWFHVDEDTAERVMTIWAIFAAMDPYDKNGGLKADWKQWVEDKRLNMDNVWCWETFVYGKFIGERYYDRMHRRGTALITSRASPAAGEKATHMGGGSSSSRPSATSVGQGSSGQKRVKRSSSG